MKFYRGYFEVGGSDGKMPLQKWKREEVPDSELLTLDAARGCRAYGGALTEHTALIDVDDAGQSDILLDIVIMEGLKCRVVGTDRGKHFIFRNDNKTLRKNQNRQKLAVGLDADIKVGWANSYEKLKSGGKERTAVYGEEYTDTEQLDTVPEWLRPIQAIKNAPAFDSMTDGDGRNTELFKWSFKLQKAGLSQEAVVKACELLNGYVLPDPLAEQEINTVLRPESLNVQPGGRFAVDPLIMEKLDEVKPETYPLNDRGFGQLYADVFAERLRYNATAKCWHYYDGKRWIRDGGMIADRFGKALFDALVHYAAYIEDEIRRTAFLKAVTALSARRKRETMIADAQSIYCFTNEELDADPYKLNCQNGVLDLRTLTLHEHSPADLMTKICSVDYKPGAKSELFSRFIDEVMEGDREKTEFLQKCFGYCLLGVNPLEKLFILHGSKTRNGKSTLSESFAHAIGGSEGYAQSLNPESLATLKNKNGAQASPDIAALDGARYVAVSEPSKTMYFDVALLKKLTGSESIKARRLHENGFDVKTGFKIFIDTNPMPNVNDPTLFASDRVYVIEFNRYFTDEERDDTLKPRLKQPEHAEAILAWAVEGLQKYRREGLKPPKCVRDAVREYEDANDRLKLFFEDCMEEKAGANASVKEVFDPWRGWSFDNGYQPGGKQTFIQDLKTKELYAPRGTVNGKQCRNIVPGFVVTRGLYE